MPRKPLAITELRSTPEQRAAQLAWARRYYQKHIAPIDKLWGECERRAKERMMEERPLAERVAELETIVQSILRREAEDIVAQHEQPAPAPTVADVLDRLRGKFIDASEYEKGKVGGPYELAGIVNLTIRVVALIDEARREAGR
jgi:hypothetical protein